MAVQRLNLTRDQLASFLQDFEQIKQFEKLFSTVDTINTVTLDEISVSAGSAFATANEALAQISGLSSQTEFLAFAPPDLGGTVTSVSGTGSVNGITLTGTVTASGFLTLGGTLSGVSLTTQVAGILPIANGGTNGIATPTAGGVAYGTGTAYAVNAAGPAGYVLTSGGAAPPVWTPVASLAVGTEAYWGSFWDTTTQTAAAINTAYALTLNTADVENNGVTIVSGSRVTFTHAGVYSLIFSAQLTNTDNSNTAHIANIWLRKNGVNVTATDSKFTVPGKFGTAQGAIIGTVNFVLPLAANDYIELVWSTNDTSLAVTSFPAGTTPVSPVVPSIIFTAVAAAPVGLGYAGVESLTSLTVGTGSQTFTVNTNATDTAFIVGNRVRLVNSSVNYMDGVITAYSGTSMTVLVDGAAGSGTYTAWFVTLTGSVGGVTSFSGNSTGLTPATPTAGAISLAGTLNVANGGTGQTTYTNGQLLIGNTTGNTLAKATLTAGTNVSITNGAGSITINATDQFVGTVTSVSGTGTVNGITLTGTVTSSGSLTLGGTLSGVSLTTQVSGTLPVANGGTNAGAFTAGSVVFAGTSGTYTQNNASLFWDNTNARLGIGTATPGAMVEVVAATTTDALRITQTGAGNALVVEDSANPDATPFVITTSGIVVNGNATSVTVRGVAFKQQIIGTDFAGSAPLNLRYAANAGGPGYEFAKTRSTTATGNAIVASGDSMGNIGFSADDGTQYIQAASISAVIDGTPGVSDMPGRLVFSTTADGAASPTERVRIDSAGNIGVNATPVAGYGNSIQLKQDGAGAAGSFLMQNLSTSTQQLDILNNALPPAGGYTAGYNFTSTGAAATRYTSRDGEHSWFISNATGTAGAAVTFLERMRIDAAGSVSVGVSSIATVATDGFLYIPACAGTPTGTPTAKTGLAPMVIDSTNNKLYAYIGGAWRVMN